MKRDKLLELYIDITQKLGLDDGEKNSRVNSLIKTFLNDFMKKHKRVAIYCYGYHTKMLMTDFVSNIRDVICIVDKKHSKDEKGFQIIKDNELDDYKIDGVIISSYKFKEEIKESLKKSHPRIDYLDIYDKLKERNINLTAEYYCTGPYQVYNRINTINNALEKEMDSYSEYLSELLKLYVLIKDFRMAIEISNILVEDLQGDNYRTINERLKEVYRCQINLVATASKNNVLLLCMDGMRYCDFVDGKLEKTRCILKDKGHIYTRAYSYSTMTFESLVPAFSENTDQRTEYFLKDEVPAKQCRFCNKAFEQNRQIYIYGDGYEYISGDEIKHIGNPQTLSEKLWDLTIDIADEENGLFYVHELYESHYSYPNPYTKGNMVATGTAMLFDFLPQNGGKLQTDYPKQLWDSLKYIDDTLASFVDALPCSFLMFADHGNMLLDKDTKYDSITPLQLTASEEWIRIPWIIVSDHMKPGESDTLITLLDINDVVLALLDNRKFFVDENRRYIKIGRSAIYNPDFKEIYKMINVGYSGEAFEGFIFCDGYKLIVYSDGRKVLYKTDSDELVNDEKLLKERCREVSKEITIL